jgi:hypothetical protein
MRVIVFLFSLLVCFSSNAIESIKANQLIGTWIPDNVYQWDIPKFTLIVNPDFSAEYYNADYGLICPKEHFSVANDIYQFRCFGEDREIKRLSIGGWGPTLFGFEYWIGGSPDAPTSIYGGGPVSFKKQSSSEQ